MTDRTGTTNRTYDEENRVLTKTVPYIGTTDFKYDIIHGVEEREVAEESTDPKGNVVRKVYDRAGRLKKVISGDQTVVYTYREDGSRKSVEYNDGSREEYEYYSDGLLRTLTNKDRYGSVIDSYYYEYDSAHNQVLKVDAKGPTRYAYDNMNRLYRITEPERYPHRFIRKYKLRRPHRFTGRILIMYREQL